MTDSLAVRIEGALATVDLNRPDKGNQITRPMMVEFPKHIRELSGNKDVRVIAIRSRGPDFCLGRDGSGGAREAMTAHEERHRVMGVILGVYDAIAASSIPVVACVQGDAFGFGAAMSGGCDITLASDKARFGFNEIEHNSPPLLAMSSVLRKVPAKALSYLVYSGEKIAAQTAVSFGLASRVFPAASFESDADTFLKTLASRPRLTLETIKQYQSKTSPFNAEMASEYAATLFSVMRTAK